MDTVDQSEGARSVTYTCRPAAADYINTAMATGYRIPLLDALRPNLTLLEFEREG